MISGFELWLFFRLDALQGLFAVLGIVTTLLGGFLVLFGCLEDEWERVRKAVKWSAIVFVISILFLTLVPSTKEAAAIWVIPKVATTENVNAVTGEIHEIYDLGKDYLEEKLSPVEEDE